MAKMQEEEKHYCFPRKVVAEGLHQNPFPSEAVARAKTNNKLLTSGEAPKAKAKTRAKAKAKTVNKDLGGEE